MPYRKNITMFHINPETGDPGRCSAKPGNCPFASEHFATKDEARAAYEKQQSFGNKMQDYANQPLLEELELWVSDGPLGRFLNHPLVQDIMVDAMPGLANERYIHNKKVSEAALESGDFHRYIFTHERPFRANKLYELHGDGVELPTEVYEDVWVDSENIWQNQPEWEEMLEDIHGRGERLGEDFDSLPEEIVVYRGGSKVNMEGFSWTTDPEKAKWFSTRLRRPGETPLVHELTVRKEDAVGYITSRGESEVILSPASARRLMETAKAA